MTYAMRLAPLQTTPRFNILKVTQHPCRRLILRSVSINTQTHQRLQAHTLAKGPLRAAHPTGTRLRPRHTLRTRPQSRTNPSIILFPQDLLHARTRPTTRRSIPHALEQSYYITAHACITSRSQACRQRAGGHLYRLIRQQAQHTQHESSPLQLYPTRHAALAPAPREQLRLGSEDAA